MNCLKPMLWCCVLVSTTASLCSAEETFGDGWRAAAPRDEIKPSFRVAPIDGAGGRQALVITTDETVGQHGWFQKTFPVTGGQFVRFHAARRTENVETPRRSAIVRIVWQDADGKPVLADVPPGHENEPGGIPLAEPEHPLDGATDDDGLTTVEAVYRVPSKATQAIVELHLQWAPRGSVVWSDVSLTETSPPPARKVRLATIHYRPSGKSPRANCEEFAPLVAAAAKQKADLVVLGETVPYVGVGKKPHETAEVIPGPLTEYFAGLAKQNKLHLVACLYEREDKAVYNTAILLGPDGKLIGKYRKVCLPHSEVEAGVTPGEDYPVFDTQLGKIRLDDLLRRLLPRSGPRADQSWRGDHRLAGLGLQSAAGAGAGLREPRLRRQQHLHRRQERLDDLRHLRPCGQAAGQGGKVGGHRHRRGRPQPEALLAE
jgi:hypothetical protein